MNGLVRLCLLISMFRFAALAQDIDPADSALANHKAGESSKFDAFLKLREQEAIRTKLSTLWTVVSLNMIGADILASYIPGTQEEVVDFAGGEDQVKYAMLAGAVIYEIPISMIFLSRYLPYKANRWTNVCAAALTAIAIIGGGSLKPHYIFLASAEILTLSYITWTALKWRDGAAKPDGSGSLGLKHDIGLNINSQKGLFGLNYAYKF